MIGMEYTRKYFGLKEGFIDKLDRCNDRKICGKLLEKKNEEIPVTSTFI
jgi:hypothetical protein